jgi:broad specificity phosphatase PhoE
MKTTLLVIRHAESIANEQKICAGFSDFDISNTGYTQIKNLTNRLTKMHIDTFYSSHLTRAIKTITPTANYFNKELIIRKDLMELNFGIVDGMLESEIAEKYPDVMKNFDLYLFPYRAEGEESFEEGGIRLQSSLLDIARQNVGKTVAIATHSVVLMLFLCNLLKRKYEDLYKNKRQQNTCINFLEYDSETDKLNLLVEADNTHNE